MGAMFYLGYGTSHVLQAHDDWKNFSGRSCTGKMGPSNRHSCVLQPRLAFLRAHFVFLHAYCERNIKTNLVILESEPQACTYSFGFHGFLIFCNQRIHTNYNCQKRLNSLVHSTAKILLMGEMFYLGHGNSCVLQALALRKKFPYRTCTGKVLQRQLHSQQVASV